MNPLDDFLVRAALAGLGVVLIAGPMGCLVLWRRMAYSGDATAHAALLGVALALLARVPLVLGVAAVALAAALAIGRASGGRLGGDALLGVAAHGGLALALVVLSLVPDARGDLTGWLFGDILAVSPGDVLLIWVFAAAGAALLARLWSGLVDTTINEELAAAEGHDPTKARMVLMTGLAAVVALGLQVVGALLVVALLILPAAAARPLARTPEGMAAAASALGAVAVLGGLRMAWVLDTPAGPSIVAVALGIFLLTSALSPLLRR